MVKMPPAKKNKDMLLSAVEKCLKDPVTARYNTNPMANGNPDASCIAEAIKQNGTDIHQYQALGRVLCFNINPKAVNANTAPQT